MKLVIALMIVIVLSAFGLLYIFRQSIKQRVINPVAKETRLIVKPLEKYTFENLRDTTFPQSQITLGEIVKDDDEDFVSRMFYFTDPSTSRVSSDEGSGQAKKVSGLMNMPRGERTYPVIVMFRGFVEQDMYTPGEGTRRTGEEFARQGFITLAPDFLGYGESEMPSEKPIEERFQTYTTALSLLSSLETLNPALEKIDASQSAAIDRLGIWAHSNGGQIALSTLAITGKPIPTVLWAPVTKPFPYNILYFTDEYDDEGKALRKVVSDFEKDYNVFDYSVTRYIDWIQAPLQLHQGSIDEAVPQRWSDQFDKLLTDKDIEHEYFVYPGENHNFNNGGWEQAVTRSIEFYTTNFSHLSQ